MFDINKIDFPYPIDETSHMGSLIIHINYQLYQQGQTLYWFQTRKWSHWPKVTVHAGIFKIGDKHRSINDETCIVQLVRWTWCPKVGKTKRCQHYTSLLRTWRKYSSDESEIPPPLIGV